MKADQSEHSSFDDVFNLYLLTACDMTCSFCYASKDLGAMPIEKVRAILTFLKEAGATRINLTGGEILMYGKAFEAVSFAHSLGLRVTMFTSGSMLNEDRIAKFAPYIDWLALSLDGDEAVNREMGRSERHFQSTVAALRLTKTLAPQVKVRVATVVTTVNVARLQSLGRILAIPEHRPNLWRLKQMVPTRAGKANYGQLGTEDRVFSEEMEKLEAEFGGLVPMQILPKSSKVADTMCIHPNGESTITVEDASGMEIRPLGNFFESPQGVLDLWNTEKHALNSRAYGKMWLSRAG